MIELSSLTKKFLNHGQSTTILQDINLSVKKGESFGIIGQSGAGKSTLVRCVNLLEKPTSGEVIVGGHYLLRMSANERRKVLSEIGMVFQQFNLLSNLTAAQNIEFPLKLINTPATLCEKTLNRLLELVGLSAQAKLYPAQLSAGQKQRVAIARALATKPKVLLCDEVTSCLDPQNTMAILDLLKEINKELDVTLLIITHEMSVIKAICDRVALLDQGHLIEQSDVYTFFTAPAHPLAKRLVTLALQTPLPNHLAQQLTHERKSNNDHSLLRFFFHGDTAEKPLIATLVRNYFLEINILQANVEFINGRPLGIMLVAVQGDESRLPEAIQYLKHQDVAVEVLGFIHGNVHFTN